MHICQILCIYTVAHLEENRELLDIIAGNLLPVEQEVITEGKESIAAAAVAVDEVAQQIQATHDLYDYLSPSPTVVAVIMQAVSPKNALNALLTTISESQLAGYNYCYSNKIPLPDTVFQLWKCLTDMSLIEIVTETDFSLLSPQKDDSLVDMDIQLYNDVMGLITSGIVFY